MVSVETQGLRKSFGDTEVLKGIDLKVPEGCFAVLVGPSGCGKSTLLRLLAGLEQTSAGTILMGGEDVTTLAPKDRDIAMVFQSYALYPHMTVRDNLAFGLKLRKTPASVIAERVAEASSVLGLDALLDRYPRALSGGQRQRVAMGRAIVRRSKLFLFDEPLSNLDPALRTQVRVDIRTQHDRLGATSVYVTHDQVEAMTLADLLFVLNAGEVQQSGSPLELYERPANRFVAGFVGSPAMNFIEGCRVTSEGDAVLVGEHRLALPEAEETRATALSDREVCLGIRPHDLEVVASSTGALPFTPSILETLGPEVHAHGICGGHELVIAVPAESSLRRDAAVHVRPTRVHLFDPDTGVTLR
ncbi:MAG: ABC transporter ATP-binding protein [Nannocystaceae bacterium]